MIGEMKYFHSKWKLRATIARVLVFSFVRSKIEFAVDWNESHMAFCLEHKRLCSPNDIIRYRCASNLKIDDRLIRIILMRDRIRDNSAHCYSNSKYGCTSISRVSADIHWLYAMSLMLLLIFTLQLTRRWNIVSYIDSAINHAYTVSRPTITTYRHGSRVSTHNPTLTSCFFFFPFFFSHTPILRWHVYFRCRCDS